MLSSLGMETCGDRGMLPALAAPHVAGTSGASSEPIWGRASLSPACREASWVVLDAADGRRAQGSGQLQMGLASQAVGRSYA